MYVCAHNFFSVPTILVLYICRIQAIFQAHGPAFKKNYTPEAFDNIHLYSLMCGRYCMVHVFYICTSAMCAHC